MAVRKRRKKTQTAAGDGELYPEGVPLDDNGNPIQGAEVDPEVLANIPLDADSARMQKLHQDIMQDRANGGTMRWHGDAAYRYAQVCQMYPQSSVAVAQAYPVRDESLAPQPVAVLRTYEELKQYIRDNHWRGHHAKYEWKVYDDLQPCRTQGKIEFGVDPVWAKKYEERMSKSPQGPPQPPNPYGFQYPPQFYPPQVPMMQPYGLQPQPMVAPQPQPQPVLQAPAPAPAVAPQPAPQPQPQPQMPMLMQVPPAPPASDGGMMQMVIEQNRQNMQLMAQFFQQILQSQQAQQQQPASQPMPLQPIGWQQTPQGMIPIYAQPAQPPAQEQPPPAPEQPDRLTQAKQAMTTLVEAVAVAQNMRDKLAPAGERVPNPVEEAAAVQAAEDSPLAIQDVGMVRMAWDKKTGAPVDSTTAFMMNLDKISDAAGALASKVSEIMKQRETAAAEAAETQVQQKNTETERKMQLLAGHQEIERRKLELAAAKPKAQTIAQTVAPPAPEPPPPPPAPAVIEVAPEPPPPPEPPEHNAFQAPAVGSVRRAS